MPDFTPTVSVVVPVYNGAEVIGACIESLLQQNYPPTAYEVIVVENGSTDETTRLAQFYPVLLCHSPARGPAAARNLGIANSQAEIVAFTDADCLADPVWLAELVKPYAHPDTGGVGGSIHPYRGSQRNPVELFSEAHSPLTNYWSGSGEYLPHLYTANASYRREIVNRAGGFNPALLTAEDVDLSWRVQLQTASKLSFASQAVVHHRHRSTRRDLARQYRQYGYGEILLDTLYANAPAYPRTRAYQFRRMARQAAALPRYALSLALRRARLALGLIPPDQAATPGFWLLIEWNNLLGKLEALRATHGMRDARPALSVDAKSFIERYYP